MACGRVQVITMNETDSVERLHQIRNAIRRAAADVERDPESITLIAVSKTFPTEAIVPVLAAGQRVFGENYVQEAKAKWPTLREDHPGVELHLIGPLQSNKAKDAVQLFDVIHTLDRPSLAEALAKEMAKSDRKPRLLVQVNTGEEPQKGGVLPQNVDGFLEACRSRYGLTVEGLMCIPPAEDAPSPHFALLQSMAKRHALPLLSMGMSADFEAAIQLGATHVRVGSAIFGSRTSA
jgi:pyridoxal phosphate enzyme (YggS family)